MASAHAEGRQGRRVPSSWGSSSGFVLFQTLNFHIKDDDLSISLNLKLIPKEPILKEIPRIMLNQIFEQLWPCQDDT